MAKGYNKGKKVNLMTKIALSCPLSFTCFTILMATDKISGQNKVVQLIQEGVAEFI